MIFWPTERNTNRWHLLNLFLSFLSRNRRLNYFSNSAVLFLESWAPRKTARKPWRFLLSDEIFQRFFTNGVDSSLSKRASERAFCRIIGNTHTSTRLVNLIIWCMLELLISALLSLMIDLDFSPSSPIFILQTFEKLQSTRFWVIEMSHKSCFLGSALTRLIQH